MRPALLLTLLVAGCASTGSPRLTADQLPACVDPTAPDGWRQVTTDGLSLCVPADWTSAGPTAWRGGGGKIRWQWNHRMRRLETRVEVIRADQVPASTPTRSLLHRSTETVSGARADLFIVRSNDGFDTGASLDTASPLFLSGEAPSRHAAEVQLDIYRTVRVLDREAAR